MFDIMNERRFTMDIYEYAMQMEKDGEQYYREIAGKMDNKGIKNILTMLADEDLKHYNIFFSMKRNEKIQITDTPILTNVKNIFIKMREEKDFGGISASQTELYKKAQDIEKKSWDFYLEKGEEANDPLQKEVFLKVAGEEKKHYFILEQIIYYISRPDQLLENPEWYHIEEY